MSAGIKVVKIAHPLQKNVFMTQSFALIKAIAMNFHCCTCSLIVKVRCQYMQKHTV